MELFGFAYCPHFDQKLNSLASLCPEKWSFGSATNNSILKNYILHTFKRVQEENKVLAKDNYAVFNTGLFTPRYEQIFAYFKRNSIPNRQPWFFDSFLTKYQLVTSVTIQEQELPERANYITELSDLIFDTRLSIVPQYDHIFTNDNLRRLPPQIQSMSNKEALFDGAIKRTKLMIEANYKTAVPQYYKGAIQLLLPLCLTSENIPDIAIVVNKDSTGTRYIAHTNLTLDMAYNNARLIARPDSLWLRP